MLLFFQILQIISALLTIGMVLLHSAKGEGIGSIGSASQMFSSSSELEKGLNLVTWFFGLVFLMSSALLSWGFIR
ncbi:MAG: preprotein translocase subunit SecG [Candidatus Caenarcaniphilales bacterium]|nr:preprotein translocase subunit SecG [Candidatus Caenarcaniphilales bacterium]